MTRRPKSIAFVVPCFNEEETLDKLVARLEHIDNALVELGAVANPARIILVDDGSSDGTWKKIIAAKARSNVTGVKLSRNYGQQAALLAGLDAVVEDVAISLDADLQDDPDAVPRMLEAYAEGAEIVYGVRSERAADTWFKRVSAQAYYRLLTWLGAKVIHNHSDFRLLSRKVLTELRRFGEVNVFLRGILPSLGFPSAIVEYTRPARLHGETKYDLHGMIALAIEGITSFSVRPLRLVTYLGFSLAISAFTYAIYAVIAQMNGQTVPGWTSTILPIFFLGGVQLIAVGIIGEYVGKIYLEVKQRPRYIVERVTDQEPD